MSRQLKQDLEQIFESMHGPKMSMNVGSTKQGDLEGKTKEINKGTGPENSEVPTAKDADASLQGSPKDVEDSKKKKGGTVSSANESRGISRFDALYKSVSELVSEAEGDIENDSFDDTIGDFPPAGAEEEAAERSGEEEEAFGDETVKDLFLSLADICTKLAGKFEHEEAEILDGGEPEIGEGEEIPMEAVESSPAPDGVSKLTAKGAMNVGGTKVVKTAVSSSASGQEDGGKPKNAKPTNLGPHMKFKANGSGAAVDGKDASAFE